MYRVACDSLSTQLAEDTVDIFFLAPTRYLCFFELDIAGCIGSFPIITVHLIRLDRLPKIQVKVDHLVRNHSYQCAIYLFPLKTGRFS